MITDGKSWLTVERLRIYPRAVLAAMVVGFVLLVASPGGIGTTQGDPGGDFRSFYAAGEIARSDRSARLYDWSLQREIQAAIAPGSTREFLPFAYPPFVALAYSPLSRLDFRLAYVVNTVSMALLVYAAVLLLAPLLPRIGSNSLAIFVALLAFYPLLRAVGGQTSAVGVVLVALAWRCLHDERDLTAGIAMGLLLFKPQLALPLIGLVGLFRRPRILAGFAISAALLYAAGAALSGWSWLLDWWGQLGAFQRAQFGNTHQSIGIIGFAEALIGFGNRAAIGIGGVLSAALAAILAWTWYRARTPLNLLMGMTCCALVLIPPHSLYYDAGIAGLGLVVLADERGWADRVSIAALYLAAYLTPLSGLIGFSPMFPIVVALLIRLRAASAG